MARSVPSRQILVRIGWLCGALLVRGLLALAGRRRLELDAIREIVDEEAEEHGRLLDGVLELAGNPLRLLVEGYGRRTLLTRRGEHESAGRAEAMLEAGLRLYGLDAAWIFEPDGKLGLQVGGAAAQGMAPPVPASVLLSDTAPMHFFLEHAGTIYEVRGRRLAAPRGDESRPRGWIFAAYRLDAARLAAPRLPVEGQVSLVPPAAAGEPPRPGFPVRIERPLPGRDGRTVAILRVDYHPAEIEIARLEGRLARSLMAGFVLLALAVLGFSVWRWVVRPAMLMQASLAAEDARALQPLFDEGGDLARLAGFVQHSLENQQHLRQTLEERARLGRDLHDGVIQTIYSAGLGLARVRNHLQADPAKADALLLEVRASLDEAVKELRRHLGEPEPVAAGPERLQQALENLKVLAHRDGNVRVDIQVEPAAEAMLHQPQLVHVLHFASEAFSNALRHGGASALALRLTLADAATVQLVVSDDGAGFDPAAPGNPAGRGLSNLRQRASQLGGTLAVDAARGRGTRLSVAFQPS